MKLKGSYETEVYISTGGYLCIKQEDRLRGGDSIVMLSPEQARLVVQEISSCLEDTTWWECGREADIESDS